ICRRSQGPEGVWFGDQWISSLLFANNVVLLAPFNQDLQTYEVHSGSSTSYNLNSSQPFASCLSTASTLPPLLNQGQTSMSESDIDDCRFQCQGNSPRESLSSQYVFALSSVFILSFFNVQMFIKFLTQKHRGPIYAASN
ncbi:hypothetical protein ILYODFUR_036841, partial [Ilyodon furcidens]